MLDSWSGFFYNLNNKPNLTPCEVSSILKPLEIYPGQKSAFLQNILKSYLVESEQGRADIFTSISVCLLSMLPDDNRQDLVDMLCREAENMVH